MSQFNVGEDNAKHDPEISEWVQLECYQGKVIHVYVYFNEAFFPLVIFNDILRYTQQHNNKNLFLKMTD